MHIFFAIAIADSVVASLIKFAGAGHLDKSRMEFLCILCISGQVAISPLVDLDAIIEHSKSKSTIPSTTIPGFFVNSNDSSIASSISISVASLNKTHWPLPS